MAGLILNRNGVSRDPFKVARELFAYDPFWQSPQRPRAQSGFAPTFNVVETDDAYVIEADLPGVADSDLSITLEKQILEIKGSREATEKKESDSYHLVERRFGTFSRSFRLPDGAAEDGITAALTSGVLTVKVPKRPELAPRTIEIKTQ